MKACKPGYVALLVLLVNCNTVSEISVSALKCEYRDNPLGMICYMNLVFSNLIPF